MFVYTVQKSQNLESSISVLNPFGIFINSLVSKKVILVYNEIVGK